MDNWMITELIEHRNRKTPLADTQAVITLWNRWLQSFFYTTFTGRGVSWYVHFGHGFGPQVCKLPISSQGVWFGFMGGGGVIFGCQATYKYANFFWGYIHTETMGQITYKAFGKKFQNPGAVITALTFLWAWREDGNHLAVEQHKQRCRDEHINQNCTFTCFCWKS